MKKMLLGISIELLGIPLMLAGAEWANMPGLVIVVIGLIIAVIGFFDKNVKEK